MASPCRSQVRSVGFSSDGSKVVCGDEANKVTVLDAASGAVVWEQTMGDVVRASHPPSTGGVAAVRRVRGEGGGVAGLRAGAVGSVARALHACAARRLLAPRAAEREVRCRVETGAVLLCGGGAVLGVCAGWAARAQWVGSIGIGSCGCGRVLVHVPRCAFWGCGAGMAIRTYTARAVAARASHAL